MKGDRISGIGSRRFSNVANLSLNVKDELSKLQKAKRDVTHHEEQLNIYGGSLYNQFRDFVGRNKELFDDGFMEYTDPEIRDIEVSKEKKAFKLSVYYEGGRTMVLVPFLMLEAPEAYKRQRTRMRKFGAKTIDQIKQHYDGEISKLEQELENLRKERTETVLVNKGDWT